MSTKIEKKKSSYREPLILIAFVILGAILGLTLGEKATILNPIGQIWLNLLFVHFKFHCGYRRYQEGR